MSKKLQLYTVTISAEVAILAESEADARDFARDVDRFDCEFDYDAQPMTYLPDGWEGTEIPFGHRDPEQPDATVDDWVERGAAPRLKRTPPKK